MDSKQSLNSSREAANRSEMGRRSSHTEYCHGIEDPRGLEDLLQGIGRQGLARCRPYRCCGVETCLGRPSRVLGLRFRV